MNGEPFDRDIDDFVKSIVVTEDKIGAVEYKNFAELAPALIPEPLSRKPLIFTSETSSTYRKLDKDSIKPFPQKVRGGIL